MREYIFYATLIFLPIGYIMSLLLSREGLIKKHIIIFVSIAMIMILIFPISAERMGILYTSLVYFSLLFIIAWYFVKTNQLNYLYNLEETAFAEEFSKETEFYSPGNPVIDITPGNQNPIKITASIPTEVSINDTYDNTEINKQTANNIELKKELIVDEPVTEPVTEAISTVSQGLPEETVNSRESLTEPVESPTGEEQQDIFNLLDKAFAVKGFDLQQAINYFQAALDITENDELIYLLTMELFEDYKDIGAYGQAVNILSDFINRNAGAVDKIEQIKSSGIDIENIMNELEKPGTPDLPLSAVSVDKAEGGRKNIIS